MPDIEALKQARRVVEASPDDERFYMACVGSQYDCGSAHCAWGWIRLDLWFRKHRNTGPNGHPHNWANALGITWPQANILFAGVNRLGPKIKAEVIANIDRLIAGEEPVEYDDSDEDDILDDLDEEDDLDGVTATDEDDLD